MTKYEIKNTTQFKKDYKLAKKRGLNLALLKDIVTKLADGEPLDSRYKDHYKTDSFPHHCPIKSPPPLFLSFPG